VEGIFAPEGVLDEACRKGLIESSQLSFREARDDDLDLEILKPQRPLAGLCLDADEQAFGGEISQFEILGDILADAAAKRGEKQLGGRQALVRGSVFGGLIEEDFVLAGFRGEAGVAIVQQCDFQKSAPWGQHRRTARYGPLGFR
jgi:hypothetical protein